MFGGINSGGRFQSGLHVSCPKSTVQNPETDSIQKSVVELSLHMNHITLTNVILMKFVVIMSLMLVD